MTRIGRVDPAAVAAAAARLAELGGPPAMADPAECGPAEVTAITRTIAATEGGQVVASGGTTGKIKITTIAHHQGIPRLLNTWHPLHAGDVLLNLFRPGRLWGAHYFYNALAAHCAASVLPMGTVSAEELLDWSAVFADTSVTALAGAPSGLADFAAAAIAHGVKLPVRTVIWAGEPMTSARREVISEAFPGCRFWGNYGSIETYVIGVSRPECDSGVLHLLPDQLIESDDERALLTRTGDGWPVPVVRYRLGDRVAAATCPCGEGDAFRVLGRTDDRVKFHNTMLCLGDVLDVVREVDGVTDVQLVLTADGPGASEVEVRYLGTAAATAVRAHLLRKVYALTTITAHKPDSVSASRSSTLDRNDRTGKVTPYTWREQRKVATH
ncbi:AMP-binding protein [Actinokineospora sp. HUAS TT18]|uniref:AMP-binding protein n=1 Tax=Actinokineospora sp. HUAS TT18 TaxID=3447451 RepID=UPI003F528BF9